MSPRRPTRCYVCDAVETASAAALCDDCQARYCPAAADTAAPELTPPAGTEVDWAATYETNGGSDCPACGHEVAVHVHDNCGACEHCNCVLGVTVAVSACSCSLPGTWCPQHSGSWPP